MPKLIKNGQLLDNPWTILDKSFSGEIENKASLVPKAYWLAHAASLENTGVWLDSDEGPEELAPYLDRLSVIAINFPKFADGRGYSHARILRDRYGFKGDIMAIGDVLHDQLFYLKRCGFNVFAIREDKNAEIAMTGLSDFSDAYQAACDQAQPLFRRRSA
jgi:uncharacterized protein (DUF934 family)